MRETESTVSPQPDDDVTLEPPPSEAEPAAPARHQARTVVAAVLGVLAVISLVLSVVSVWARNTVTNSDRVANLAGDALAEPDVQSGLATYLTDQLFTSIDVTAELQDLLPTQLDRFAPALSGAAESAVQATLTKVLGNEDVERVMKEAVKRAHRRAVELLRGDGLVDGVSVENGEVSVNLLPLASRALTTLQGLGVLQRVDLPTFTAEGDPQQQIAELSSALGRDLPADFGQLVVYRSASVESAQQAVQDAQRIVVVARRALVLVLLLTVALIVATIIVAPRRWRAVLVLGLGVAATMALLRSAVRVVVAEAPNVATRPGARAAIEAMVSGASTSLMRLAGVALLLGLGAVAAALLVRHWRRADLILVVAVVVGAIVVAVIGLSLWSLLAGIAVAVAVPFVARAAFPARAQPPAPVAS